MSTTQNLNRNGKQYFDICVTLCAEAFTLVDTLGINVEVVHWEAKLLNASTMASFELLSRIFLIGK